MSAGTYKVAVDGEIVYRSASRSRAQAEADAYMAVEYGHLQDVEVLDPEGFAVDRNGNRV
jgi:hypothetical protein